MNASAFRQRAMAALAIALWLACPPRIQAQSPTAPDRSADKPRSGSRLATLDSRLTAAVVRVVAGGGAVKSAGTGTLIASDGTSGIVLTCAHVVGSNSRATAVWPDGYQSTGRVLCVEPRDDIAVFEVTPPEGAVVLPLAGDDEWPRAGETVELCGFGGSKSGGERPRHWSAVAQGYAQSRSGRHHTLSVATQTISGDSGGPIVHNGNVVAVLWGGPLAGPRGPMIATHGTYSGRIREIMDGCGLGGWCQPCEPPSSGQAPNPKPQIPNNPQTPISNPQTPAIDYDRLADAVIARLKEDGSFRGLVGPQGPAGPQGPPGPPGGDGAAAQVDLDELAEAVQQRIIKSITVRVEPVH